MVKIVIFQGKNVLITKLHLKDWKQGQRNGWFNSCRRKEGERIYQNIRNIFQMPRGFKDKIKVYLLKALKTLGSQYE